MGEFELRGCWFLFEKSMSFGFVGREGSEWPILVNDQTAIIHVIILFLKRLITIIKFD